MKDSFFQKKLWVKLGYIIILFSMVIVLKSCYPGDDLTPADTDLIATIFDPEVDFSTKMTYALPDSIGRIDEDGNFVSDPGPYDQQVISRIESNLIDMGYTEAANPAGADVIVIAFINKSTWVSGGCYYDWWYGWWYPYYGWCYPTYYTYQTGSIMIAMLNPNNTEAKNAMWIAAINGLLEDTSAGIATRINNNIDQAFAQSPYLADGK